MPALIATAAGGAAVGSALSSKKNKGLDVAADPYGRVRNQLVNWLTGDPNVEGSTGELGHPGKSYAGEMVAPMSDQEKQSLEYLKKYGQTGYGDTFNQAKAEISKTLTNQYDPTTSPYYQATKAAAEQNLNQTQRNIASNSAGAGRYWSGARLKAQSNAARDVNLGMNTMLGQMAETERQRKLDVIPQAVSMAKDEQSLPLQQATAYQTLGGLPRSIQQAMDSATQNEWLRSQIEYPMQIASLAANVQTPPTYQQKPPSAFEQLLSTAGNAAGTLLPLLLMSGGCWVAAEIFGGWYHPKTEAARYYINFHSPRWFKRFYFRHGQKIAQFIKDKPVFKIALRPLFELFAYVGLARLRKMAIL